MRIQAVKDVEKTFLEPSFRYFVENGLENTSVRDLCKAMNISYGSLYYWFDGKDDFYISVMEYGIEKVATKLFEVAFETLGTPELFFDMFLDEADKYLPELRAIYQVTASPEYGKIMRRRSMPFKETYAKYINELSKILGIGVDTVTPVIYLLISVLSDYVVWEDRESSQLQLQFLHDSVFLKCKNK